MVTTWPCVTEAMHLLHRFAGWKGQEALWQLISSEAALVMDLDREAVQRTTELMAKYRGVPMDLADATLVALAERLRQRSVFTLDGHFRIYRLKGRQFLDVVP
jgi:predicted nucleic acid-binding protein